MIIRTYDVNGLLTKRIEDLAPYFPQGDSKTLGNPPSSGGSEAHMDPPETARLIP